jgi:hypothetical protein
VIQPGPHGHRDDRSGALRREVEVLVEEMELGAGKAVLDRSSGVGWEQVEPALHEPPAAGLVPGELLLLEDHNLEPPPREGERGGGPGGPAADNSDVEHASS